MVGRKTVEMPVEANKNEFLILMLNLLSFLTILPTNLDSSIQDHNSLKRGVFLVTQAMLGDAV